MAVRQRRTTSVTPIIFSVLFLVGTMVAVDWVGLYVYLLLHYPAQQVFAGEVHPVAWKPRIVLANGDGVPDRGLFLASSLAWVALCGSWIAFLVWRRGVGGSGGCSEPGAAPDPARMNAPGGA